MIRRRQPVKLSTIAKTLGAVAAGGAALAATFAFAVRPWYMRWGATGEEVRSALPGDELIPNAVYEYTRAITIAAPVEHVWSWLIQIGQDRGGFYSYDWLENLIGCDIHSVDRIVPELQELKVGDTVRMMSIERYPAGPSFAVVDLEPNHYLVMQGQGANPHEPAPNEYAATWAFVVRPIDEHHTRLLVRARAHSDPAWVSALFQVEPAAFIMERAMLKGIKQRAEANVE
jgi:hypothetical protein